MKCQGHPPKSSFPWPGCIPLLASIFLTSEMELNNEEFIIIYGYKGVKIENIEKNKVAKNISDALFSWD